MSLLLAVKKALLLYTGTAFHQLANELHQSRAEHWVLLHPVDRGCHHVVGVGHHVVGEGLALSSFRICDDVLARWYHILNDVDGCGSSTHVSQRIFREHRCIRPMAASDSNGAQTTSIRITLET